MNSYRLSLFAIALIFIPLLVLSIIFYKERAFAFDAAYQLFDIIQTQSFAIQGTRFGAIFLQFPSWLVAQFTPDLNNIGMIYSVSGVLLPALVTFLIWKMKYFELVGVALLFPIIFLGHSFYWAHSELFQSCYWAVLSIALLFSSHKSIVYQILFAVSLIVTIFLHPVAPILVGYGIGFLFLRGDLDARKADWIITLTGIILLIKFFIFPTMAYDANIYARSGELFHRFWNFFSFKSSRQFRAEWLGNYWLYLVCISVIFQYYYRRNQYIKIGLVLGSTLAYLYTVHSLFRWALPLFQMENYYMAVGWMLAFPIVFDVIPEIPKRSWKTSIFLFMTVFAIRVIQIKHTGEDYVRRHEKIRLTLEHYPDHHKLFMEHSKELEESWLLTWSIPYESLFMSSLNGESRTLHISKDQANLMNNAFVGFKQSIPSAQLNPRYFNLPEENYFSISPVTFAK